MKLITDGRNLEVQELEDLYSGNVNSYDLEVEISDEEKFKDLVCYVTFINGEAKRKVLVGPDNMVKIPFEVLENSGDLAVGFCAYDAENEEILRYSSDICVLEVEQGAFDKHLSYSEGLSPNVLEKYLIEMKELYNNYINEMSELENSAKEIQAAIELSEKNAKESEENAKTSEKNAKSSEENSLDYLNETKSIAQSMSFANFELDEETGELSINTPEKFGNCGFSLNEETGNLEVEIDG